MRLRAATVVAAMVGLAVTGCTAFDEPTNVGPSVSVSPGDDAPPAMTFEEAVRKLPMNGTKDLTITWDLSQIPDSDEVLAARRALAFIYWERSSTDWRSIIPIGRPLHTEKFYQDTLAPFADVTDAEDPSRGRLWVRTVGVERTGTDEARVIFCTDRGQLRQADDEPQARKDRANLESYVVKNVQTADGERRWLVDKANDDDVTREAKYGPECTKWARHQP